MSEQHSATASFAFARTGLEKIAALGRACRRAVVLRAHALAERMDWLPSEWGRGVAVPAGDADAVLREWRRQLRNWAADYPEDALAWKIGGVILGVVLAGLVAGVGAIG